MSDITPPEGLDAGDLDKLYEDHGYVAGPDLGTPPEVTADPAFAGVSAAVSHFPQEDHSDPAGPDDPDDLRPVLYVRHGDTLGHLEARYGFPDGSLLDLNRATLDREARARGLQHCEDGRVLFPGTVLVTPHP